jgi:hypothetical protein
MGSGRDKRKKAKGTVPGQGANKTASKTEKNEAKQQRRLERKAKASSFPQTRSGGLPNFVSSEIKSQTVAHIFLISFIPMYREVKMILMPC